MVIRRSPSILAVLMLIAVASGCRRNESSAQKGATAPQTPASASASPAQQQSEEEEGPQLTIGSKMPEYSAKGLDGNDVSVADFRGKALLVNVWATWCGPCRYEIPDLIALKNKYGSRGFEIFGVSIDDEGDGPAVRDFVKKERMNYAIAHDPKADILTLFHTSVIPTSVLVDRSGKIVWMHSSVLSANDREFTSALEKALAQ